VTNVTALPCPTPCIVPVPSRVVVLEEKEALGATNEPLIVVAICAEELIKVLDNSDSAVVTLVLKEALDALKDPDIDSLKLDDISTACIVPSVIFELLTSIGSALCGLPIYPIK